MNNIETWNTAWKSLKRQGVRMRLASFAIGSATAIMVALLLFSDYTTFQMRSQMMAIQKNNTIIFNAYNNFNIRSETDNSTTSVSTAKITYNRLEKKLKSSLQQYLWTTSISDYTRARIGNENMSSINKISTDHNYFNVYDLQLLQGRYFTQWDNPDSKNCVVGYKIGKKLLDKGIKLDDMKITIDKKIYNVIGIISKQEDSMLLFNTGNTVYTQIDSAQALLNQVGEIAVSLPNTLESTSVSPYIKEVFNKSFPGYNFQISDTTSMAKNLKMIISSIEWSFFSIGIGCLILTSFNIINSTLATIYERREEIGIRLAIGARSYHIRNMFLQEIILLCCYSSIIAIAIVQIPFCLFLYFTSSEFSWPWHAPLTGFISCLTIGTFAGLYPANKAAKLKPIQVMYDQ